MHFQSNTFESRLRIAWVGRILSLHLYERYVCLTESRGFSGQSGFLPEGMLTAWVRNSPCLYLNVCVSFKGLNKTENYH